MYCDEERSMLNLLAINNCEGCPYHTEDECIDMGRDNKLYIFHLYPECLLEQLDINKFFFRNKKVKLFYKETILHPERLYLVLLDYDDEKYMDEVMAFFESYQEICILTR